MERFSYNKNSLKVEPIKPTNASRVVVQNSISEQVKKKDEEHMSNKKAFLIIVMLLVMYAMISALPTFVMMYFFDVSFWLSQVIVIIGTTVVVWLFGLYKPASEEQKLKKKLFL